MMEAIIALFFRRATLAIAFVFVHQQLTANADFAGNFFSRANFWGRNQEAQKSENEGAGQRKLDRVAAPFLRPVRVAPEIYYDSIFVKFDRECLASKVVDLQSHFNTVLSQKVQADNPPARTPESAAGAAVAAGAAAAAAASRSPPASAETPSAGHPSAGAPSATSASETDDVSVSDAGETSTTEPVIEGKTSDEKEGSDSDVKEGKLDKLGQGGYVDGTVTEGLRLFTGKVVGARMDIKQVQLPSAEAVNTVMEEHLANVVDLHGGFKSVSKTATVSASSSTSGPHTLNRNPNISVSASASDSASGSGSAPGSASALLRRLGSDPSSVNDGVNAEPEKNDLLKAAEEAIHMDRETALIASLHVLAASHLVGGEKASELLRLEAKGSTDSWRDFILKHKRIPTVDLDLIAIPTSTDVHTDDNDDKDKDDKGNDDKDDKDDNDQNTKSNGRSRGVEGDKAEGERKEEGEGQHSGPKLLTNKYLSGLQIREIKNPLMHSELLRLIQLLPCLHSEAEADRSRDGGPMDEFLVPESIAPLHPSDSESTEPTRRLSPSDDLSTHTSTGEKIDGAGEGEVTFPVNILQAPVPEREPEGGPFDNFFDRKFFSNRFGFDSPSSSPAQSLTTFASHHGHGSGSLPGSNSASNADLNSGRKDALEGRLRIPHDSQFRSQWYIRGPAQSQEFGTQVIDGWSSILYDTARGLRNSSKSGTSSGNFDDQDLIGERGSRERGSGEREGEEDEGEILLDFGDLLTIPGIPVAVLDSGCSRNPDLVNQFWRNRNTPGCQNGAFASSTDRRGENDGGVSNGVSGDCVGYDFGNDRADPTQELEGRIHGSSTSGLIAAQSDNDIGITGICPQCKIVCLKIYDSDRGKITMGSVIRALDYIARKGIRLSNHSYGGFGASSIELAAHDALRKLGHLSVCSAGNNGCNIDSAASDPASRSASENDGGMGERRKDDKGDNEFGKKNSSRKNQKKSPNQSDQSSLVPNYCRSPEGKNLGAFTPASYPLPNILSVGGTNKEGRLTWFSNYGKTAVDVFAPAEDILTLYGASQLATVKGTSFSSPIVTAVAALLWSSFPELTAEQVKTLLVTSGPEIEALRDKGKNARIVSFAHAYRAAKNLLSLQ